MAEFVVPLRKESIDSLTRQGMHNIRGLHRKRLTEMEKRNEFFYLKEHTNFVLNQSYNEKEHAPHFDQQHRNTCLSGHFRRVRWSIPQQEP